MKRTERIKLMMQDKLKFVQVEYENQRRMTDEDIPFGFPGTLEDYKASVRAARPDI